MGAGRYAWRLTRRRWSPAHRCLDYPAPTWGRLEGAADSRGCLRAGFESKGEHSAYFRSGRSRGVSIVPLTSCQFYRSLNGTKCRSVGPVYSPSGRIKRLLANFSRIFAVQPITRLVAKVEVNSSPGKPTDASTTAE